MCRKAASAGAIRSRFAIASPSLWVGRCGTWMRRVSLVMRSGCGGASFRVALVGAYADYGVPMALVLLAIEDSSAASCPCRGGGHPPEAPPGRRMHPSPWPSPQDVYGLPRTEATPPAPGCSTTVPGPNDMPAPSAASSMSSASERRRPPGCPCGCGRTCVYRRTRGLVVARAQAGPRRQMGGGRKAGHVHPVLRDDHLCGAFTDPRDRAQKTHLLGETVSYTHLTLPTKRIV